MGSSSLPCLSFPRQVGCAAIGELREQQDQFLPAASGPSPLWSWLGEKLNVLGGGLGVPPLTLFVSCQHPHFDVAQFQQLDGLRDSILQLVLDGRGPEQLERVTVSWHGAGQGWESPLDPTSSPCWG